MSGEDRAFVAWEEKIISQEKGNRLVHYYLKDSVGCSLLAVVGTERSARHMIYAISEEFLEYHDCWNTPFAEKRWRTRRDLVEWLVSMVSPVSDSQIAEPMAGFTNPGIQTAVKEELVSRKLKPKDSDIVLLGESWGCSERLKHYPAILSNGTVIPVHSFVFFMAEQETRYLGYLEDLYEDSTLQKWIKIRWFHHLHEVKCVIPQLDAHPKEVFISPHAQVISSECVDDLAAVLTPSDYQKYASVLPEDSLSGVLICSREFKNNTALPFCLSKLHGYFNQPIFSRLSNQIVSQQKEQKPAGECDAIQMTECEPARPKLRIKLSIKGPAMAKVFGRGPQCCPFKVGVYVEFLCQDSGVRGCWFKCLVIQAKQQHLKVQYLDVDDVDGPGKLEEWIPASRAAAPDELSMRCAGRLTIRPWPLKEPSKCSFKVGDAVDAWWCDGWWEGVVAGIDVSRRHHFVVYFPGDNRSLIFPRRNLRISRDWVDGKWVDIKPKHDICSFVSSATPAPNSKHSLCSNLAEVSRVNSSYHLDLV